MLVKQTDRKLEGKQNLTWRSGDEVELCLMEVGINTVQQEISWRKSPFAFFEISGELLISRTSLLASNMATILRCWGSLLVLLVPTLAVVGMKTEQNQTPARLIAAHQTTPNMPY